MRAEALAAVIMLSSIMQGSSLLGKAEVSCVLIERMTYFSSCCSPYWHARAVVLNSSGYALEAGEVIQLIVYSGGSPQEPGTLCRVSGLLYWQGGFKLVVTAAEGYFTPLGAAGEPEVALSVSRSQAAIGESIGVEFSVDVAPAQIALTAYYPSGESEVLAEGWVTPGYRRKLELYLPDPGSYTIVLAARSPAGRTYATSRVVYVPEEAGEASLHISVLDYESGSPIDGALVYVNSSLIGKTSRGAIEVRGLSTGIADVSVSKPGYVACSMLVEVRRGSNEVTIALRRAPLKAQLTVEADRLEVKVGESFELRVRIEVSREASVQLTVFSSPSLSVGSMEFPLVVRGAEEVKLRARAIRAGVWAIRAAARISAGSVATYIENHTIVRVSEAEEAAEPAACLSAKSIRIYVRGEDAIAVLSATATLEAPEAASEAARAFKEVLRLHELEDIESHVEKAGGSPEAICTGVLKPIREGEGVFTVILTDLAEAGVLQVVFELPSNLSVLRAPRGSRVVEFNETTVIYAAASGIIEVQYAVEAGGEGRSLSLLPIVAVAAALAVAALAARRLL